MFDCYTKHLHKDIPWFWQRPKRGRLHFTDKIWYDRIRVGHEPIEEFMARLSAEANLSKRYTNHSIRSTVMGILSELYEGRHVIGLSGHKSESTIKQYAARLPPKKKREMSETLHSLVQPPKHAKETSPEKPKFSFKKASSATISKPPDETPNAQAPAEEKQEENAEQLQFQIEPLNEPTDDVLLQFLEKFDAITENPTEIVSTEQAQVPLQASNTMNISNVNNVQNVGHQRMIPNMYFGGHSSVTINYNFAPPK